MTTPAPAGFDTRAPTLGLAAEVPPPAIGELVAGRYRIEARIGAGGAATVFRALDLRLGRALALKIPHGGGPQALARVRREARVAALVQAPGLLRILDVGEAAPHAYLAMELLGGETLTARVARAPLSLADAVAYVAAVAQTMALVHAHGIVHRDLKPENLFLDRQPGRGGGHESIVILDFGLGFAVDARDPALGRMSNPDETAGTPTHMPPEQICDVEVGPPADVYALGCVLFELVTGAPPFLGERAQLLAHHLYTPPPSLRACAPAVPDALDALAAAMLCKSPGRRPTMLAVAERCRAVTPAAPAAAPWAEPRTRRAVTLRPPRRPALDLDAATARRVLVLHAPLRDDDLDLTLAANDLAIQVDPAAPCDAVVVLAPDDDAIARWVATGVPVIAATAAGDLARVTRLLQQGVADVVSLPVRGEDLVRKLSRVLRRRARSPV